MTEAAYDTSAAGPSRSRSSTATRLTQGSNSTNSSSTTGEDVVFFNTRTGREEPSTASNELDADADPRFSEETAIADRRTSAQKYARSSMDGTRQQSSTALLDETEEGPFGTIRAKRPPRYSRVVNDAADEEGSPPASRSRPKGGHSASSSMSGMSGSSSRGRRTLSALGMGGVDVQGLRSAGQSVVDLTIGNSPEAVARRRAFWRAAVINVSLIGSWYLFSTIMSLYNSWLFSKKRYGFTYPLFVTSMHMLVQFALSSLLLSLCKSWVPRTRSGKRARPAARDWATKVVPCACATALDIGLSNLSLKTITLTFYTMCKSSNLAFVLIFAFLFRLEVVRLSLIGIITLITIGVVMMVAAETQFVLEGAIEVLTASAMGGLRWALTQILLDRDGMGMNNPVATVFWLAPVMFVAMISVSAAVENWQAMFSSKFFDGISSTVRTLALAIVPGLFAFCMNLSEFALIQRTSVVTLSVAGIFKEVSTIFISSTVFGDELTPINVTGLCIALVGIALYNWLKYRLLVSGDASGLGHGTSASGTRESGYEAVPNPLRNGRIRSGLPEHAREGTDEDGWADPGVAEDEESLAMSEREDGAPGLISEAELERRRKREEEADMEGGGVWKTGQGFFEDSDEEN